MSSTPETTPADGAAALRDGHVKWYSVAQGYGFLSADSARGLPVSGEDSSDIFLHHSVVGEPEDLVPGERVRFVVEAGPKGLLATRLERFE